MPNGEALVLRIARSRVKDYTDESDLMKQHHQAMDCRDCEAFLQLGIDAFTWLIRADRDIRSAAFDKKIEWGEQFDEAFEALFRSWLEPCGFADDWIKVQLQRGSSVDNLAKFRECCEQVEAIVESFQETDLPEPMAKLRDDAVVRYHDGETAEFV